MLTIIARTCKYLNQICSPLLYQDVNLLYGLENESIFQKITHLIVIPHWQHIRSLSVFIDCEHRNISNHRYVAGILSVCKNLRALSLYYHHTDPVMWRIYNEVVTLLQDHQLSQLGIYSLQVLREPYHLGMTISIGIKELINAISKSVKASQSLKVLDIVTEQIPRETYDLIRSKFTSLQSLTIRRGLRNTLGRVWDPAEHTKWVVNSHLTKLQFINCQPAYAAHIPHLVRHYPSLKELMISTCGDDSDMKPPGLQFDWNRRPDALCNVRPPLEAFHVEHMEDWEIMALGVIPTKELIITTVKQNHLLSCLMTEPELFPKLKVLRLAPTTKKPINSASLEEICKRRQIEIRRDAIPTWSCVCCGIEGF